MNDDSSTGHLTSDSPLRAMHVVSTAPSLANAGSSETVDATIETQDPHDYGVSSHLLCNGAPSHPRQAHSPTRADFRAKDLVDELKTINSQIHRIMFQVEKAVSRLSASG